MTKEELLAIAIDVFEQSDALMSTLWDLGVT